MIRKTALGWRYRLALLVMGLAGLVFLNILDSDYRRELRLHNKSQLAEAVAQAQHQLQHKMELRIHAVEDLRSLFREIGDFGNFEAFDRFAAGLREHYPSIEAFIYVDEKYVIRHAHPIAGRENVIGVDLMQRPAAPYISKAVREHRTVTDDPHITINGEMAFLIRAPIYVGGRFRGLTQGFFVIDRIVDSDFGHLLERYELQLRDQNGQVFWGPEAQFGIAQSAEVTFGDTAWLLSMRPKPGAEPTPSALVLGTIWGGGTLGLFLLLVVVHRTWAHQADLDFAIREKTAQLRLRNRELEDEIARRAAVEESLRRNRESLNDAQSLAHVGSWEWDLTENRVNWSDELYRILGFSPGDLDVNYEAFLERVHPDDRLRVQQELQAALEDGRLHETEYRILWPDGRVRHIRARGKLTGEPDAAPVRMRGIAQDVTDIKEALRAVEESEHKYRAIMESASDAIVIADLDGNLLDGNRRFLQTLGYGREELTSLTVRDIHPPEEEPKLQKGFGALREKGTILMEHLLLRKNGTVFSAEVAGTLIETGGHQLALGAFRDISQRKRMERALQRERDKLDLLVTRRTAELTIANKELEAFSYSVSHDLRAPLRAINGYCELLEQDYRDCLGSDALHYMQRMRNATVRMASLIDGLLQVSRTMRADLRRERLDMSELVRSILGELQAANPDRKVSCKVEPGVIAFCDAVLARSLLENLLNNAWKFTRGRAAAVVEFGAIEQHGRPVFFVRDNGVGLDTRDTGSLFEPFHRLHDESEFEGSGIGLATVKRIVRRHGGEVWIEAKPDKGATFYFTCGDPE